MLILAGVAAVDPPPYEEKSKKDQGTQTEIVEMRHGDSQTPLTDRQQEMHICPPNYINGWPALADVPGTAIHQRLVQEEYVDNLPDSAWQDPATRISYNTLSRVYESGNSVDRVADMVEAHMRNAVVKFRKCEKRPWQQPKQKKN